MQEAELTAATRIEAGRSYGFFTDTTVCIGCKACEVACKNWNGVGVDGLEWSGNSYDNTGDLGAQTWRHVAFVEQNKALWHGQTQRWLMMSDVCKHCTRAGCFDACPTGAIIRTEFDSIVVQSDVCNGCGYCVMACPYGVIELDLGGSGLAQKCTLCYDRLRGGLEPACAKACPTDSIQFGPLDALVERAVDRTVALRHQGIEDAYLWGLDEHQAGGLNAFFLLVDEPEVYNLPRSGTDPADFVAESAWRTTVAALLLGLFTILNFLRAGHDA